jgi:acetyl esterase/lipase
MRANLRLARALDVAADLTRDDHAGLTAALETAYLMVPTNLRPRSQWAMRDAVVRYYHGGGYVADEVATFHLLRTMGEDERARFLADTADFYRGGN